MSAGRFVCSLFHSMKINGSQLRSSETIVFLFITFQLSEVNRWLTPLSTQLHLDLPFGDHDNDREGVSLALVTMAMIS